MMPGMEMDPRIAALQRAMGGMGGDDGGAPVATDAMDSAPDPMAELNDIGMRLEAVLPALDPMMAEQLAPMLDIIRSAGAPGPEDVPQTGDDMMSEPEVI